MIINLGKGYTIYVSLPSYHKKCFNADDVWDIFILTKEKITETDNSWKISQLTSKL